MDMENCRNFMEKESWKGVLQIIKLAKMKFI